MTRSVGGLSDAQVLMLLDNPCDPDPRVLREASALTAGGAKVTILAWQREGPSGAEIKDGVEIIRVPPATGRQLGWRQVAPLLGYYRNAWRLIRERSPRIVVAHDLRTLPVGVLAAKRKRAALVYDAHEVYRWMDIGRLPDWWLRSAATAERLLVDHAVDLFVSPSTKHVEEYWGDRVRRDPVIVGNWYDAKPCDVPAARQKYGLAQVDRKLIGYAGGLDPTRQLERLLETAEQRRDIHVVIAGRGPTDYVSKIRSTAERLENATFLGWVDNPVELLGACDAIFYALDLTQPYARFTAPNTLFIAIAVDRPLIASAGGEVAAVASRSPAVILVDEPRAELIAEAVDRLPPPGNCWGHIQTEYTWTLAAERYVAALEKLVL